MKNKCKHIPRTDKIEDVFGGGIHQYYVNGDVCSKCGALLTEDVRKSRTTEQCFCQSYFDEDNKLQDCTCGMCR